MMTRLLAILMVSCAAAAAARDQSGALALLLAPNDLQPAVAAPGESFTVILRTRAEVSLAGEAGSVPLAVEWRGEDGARAEGVATLPADLPAGVYALEANGDRTQRAVFVQPRAGEYYVAAHWAAPRAAPGDAAAEAQAIVANINASDAALVLITGPLTRTGAPEEWRALLAQLESCAKPTFAVPGAGDSPEAYTGAPVYALRFGGDAYLAFDTSRLREDFADDGTSGALGLLRREIKAARFSFGVASELDASLCMRANIALFVDDPLDAVLVTRSEFAGEKGIGKLPWGNSYILAAPQSGLRFLDCTARGMLPRDTDAAAAPEE